MGITLDNRLNFHEHIKITETKVARSVGISSKLKYYLPESAMLQLYYSLVHSQLTYGVAPPKTAPLYQKLNILSLLKLNEFEIAKFIFNYSSKCLPTTFDQYFILAKTSHSQSTRYSASGSNLGPILFSIYVNDFFNTYDSAPVLYADDTCIKVEAETTNDLELLLNQAIEKASNWMKANKF